MKIKTYVVKDMFEAMLQIKHDLGDDALIISKREIKQSGLFGFMKPRLLEITAAMEEKKETKKPRKTKKTEEQEAAEQNALLLRQEIEEIKKVVISLVESQKAVATTQPVKYSDIDAYDMLSEMDLSKAVMDDFQIYIQERNIQMGEVTKAVIFEFLMNRFNAKASITSPKSKILCFIGPTGVGKTTTIAKIASIESLSKQQSVGLVTIDTYRIGAVEQLKIYANILDIPLEVVSSVEEMDEALERLSDCDRILVDTSGMSYKNVDQIEELKSFMDCIPEKEVSLVVSMTAKNTDFVHIVDSYEYVGFSNVILTKFDETQSFGNLINTFYLTPMPVSYIGMGQVVPDDIEEASMESLFKYIWGDTKL